MEEQCSPFSWGYCYQGEGNEELKYSFLYTLELENTIVSAKEEIGKREVELICLKDVLNRTVKERDDAQTKCQNLMLQNHLLQQQLQQKQKQETEEDESKPAEPNKHFSIPPTIDCNKDNNIVATSFTSPQPQQPLPQQTQAAAAAAAAASLSLAGDEKPLPEKGKLLKAVMEAGPLLQTLLLAGPLPQWQHPPPQLDSVEIPPVAISSSSPRLSNQASFNSTTNSCFSNKRGLELNEDSDSSPSSKYQKLAAFL